MLCGHYGEKLPEEFKPKIDADAKKRMTIEV